MAHHQRDEERVRPFDERLRLINTVIKPGFAAVRAESAGRFPGISRGRAPGSEGRRRNRASDTIACDRTRIGGYGGSSPRILTAWVKEGRGSCQHPFCFFDGGGPGGG